MAESSAKDEQPSSHPECPVVPGELLGNKYRIENVIGLGGMGIVVSAWHTELDRRVAIKFLLRSFANHPEASERFRREARAAARIRSEHVVRISDVSTLDDGLPYMVMEYLEGENLEALQAKVGRFTLPEVAAIVRQACDALADAHVNRIVHRDLKPPNIYLVHRNGRPPLVKVLDFGVSKSLALQTAPHLKITQNTMLVGSPLYMSPEQFETDKEIDTRSDIWGLGVLMFELLTLQMPFNGDSVPQIIRSVILGKRRPLEDINVDVPAEFEAVLDRCMAVQPDDRYTDVHELSEALRPFAGEARTWAERFEEHLQAKPAPALAYGPASGLETDRPSSARDAWYVPGDRSSEAPRADSLEDDDAPLPPIPKNQRWLMPLSAAVAFVGGLAFLFHGGDQSGPAHRDAADGDSRVAAAELPRSEPEAATREALAEHAPPPPPANAAVDELKADATETGVQARLKQVMRPPRPAGDLPASNPAREFSRAAMSPPSSEGTPSSAVVGRGTNPPLVSSPFVTARRPLPTSFELAASHDGVRGSIHSAPARFSERDGAGNDATPTEAPTSSVASAPSANPPLGRVGAPTDSPSTESSGRSDSAEPPPTEAPPEPPVSADEPVPAQKAGPGSSADSPPPGSGPPQAAPREDAPPPPSPSTPR